MAATRPMAVANNASAIGPATTARLVSDEAAILVKAFMMPHTVPNRPMKGPADPTVARKLRRFSRYSLSRAIATSSTLSRRCCMPTKLAAFCSWLRFHSFIAATNTEPSPPEGFSACCW
ncbi:hypothetical protein D3C87_1465950 [compost metagenome]